VLVLFELEGLDVRAIAEIEGIPMGTVGSRLRRARPAAPFIERLAPPSIERLAAPSIERLAPQP
jgi:hypothetical protein